jgi:hypothetical protein
MQYILSEEEMEEVNRLRAEMKTLPSLNLLQKMCTKIADEWPTWTGWDKKNPDWPAEPWGCIITRKEEGEEHYCDECPVQNICPEEHKRWSQ